MSHAPRAHARPPSGHTAERQGPAWGKIFAIALIVAGLFALWRATPLVDLVTPERVFDWTQAFGRQWWAPLAVILVYTPACFTMFPRPLITLFAVIAFGPWLGFACSMSGILLAALVTYIAGAALPSDAVYRVAGRRIEPLVAIIRRRGPVACVAVRIVPVAPFAVIGLVAGNIAIKLRDFMLGTLIGMLPGTLTTTVFGEEIQLALVDPSRINWRLVVVVVLWFVLMALVIRRWLDKQQQAGA